MADVATLKNGLQIQGKPGVIGEIGQNPTTAATSSAVDVAPILLMDDGLCRIFVPKKMLASIVADTAGGDERIRVPQRVAAVGRRIGGVGPILRVTPFDEWGRRIFSMASARGPLDVVQGITEVTPTYCRVEGLLGANPYVWDMRIATSSIPRDTLSKILLKQIDPQKADDRLRIVRLYRQAERYQDARLELEGVLKDFPELKELESQVSALRQFGARRLIKEIELRRDAGQHNLAFRMLRDFPTEGIAGETLLKVREILGEYEKVQQQGEQVLKLMSEHQAQIKDDKSKTRLEPVLKEMAAELNFNSLDRMADYLRLADDEKMSAEQKLALAVSGWLLGSDSGTENLAVALDACDVRNLVIEYLRAGRPHERTALLDKMQGLEGSAPSYLAKIIAHMKPAVETEFPDAADAIPGLVELHVPGLTGEPDFICQVQLPPEYDPYRRYPCVVTLNGSGTTPLQQVDWWAGEYNAANQLRLGQATRHGYIVIAPQWREDHQTKYQFSAREHAAVLHCLRDACRRFSIDTDRVFLSGHSMGGDAAWDIALAHPDLFAGVLPIVATSDKYIRLYWENGRNSTAFYFVGGEMDGDRMEDNKNDLNRYLQYAGFDVKVVQYQGRGHEHFHDEIQNIFDWMAVHRRDFFPREFTCVSMRPWDNFFWWAELEGFPAKSMVAPLAFPTPGARPAITEGRILDTNGVFLKTAADNATIWLTPDIVDFEKNITINGKARKIEPSSEVLLEDVRTRGDRLHPFWAKTTLK